MDMQDAAHTFELYAGMVQDQHGETLEVPGETMSLVVREPIGVTVGITPWNYPVLMAAWKAAPSLAAGNVMILKPASVSPLTSLEIARILEEAGLPKGVFQVVTGPGGEVGDYLAGSEDVDMVAFTGSVEVGKHIMRRGAENVKKVGPGARRQEPQHRVRRRRLRGRHRRRAHRHLRRHRRGVLGRLAPARRALHPRPLRRRARQPRHGDQGRRPARRGERDGPARQPAAARHGRGLRAHRPGGGRDARHRRPPAQRRAASTTSPPSSWAWTTPCASPRRRSSGRCSWSSRSTARKRRSASPTTPSTGWPERCGPRTSRAPCA